MNASVTAVHCDRKHAFSKIAQSAIQLRQGLGVIGDAHCGATVQHRSRVRRNPQQPNLRQVHLIHSELLTELRRKGFRVDPGNLGENITTAGIDLLSLPTDTVLRIGADAAIRITGLRNPCAQIEQFQTGLLAAVLDRDGWGNLVRKAGVMGVVIADGTVKPSDLIAVELPNDAFRPLQPV